MFFLAVSPYVSCGFFLDNLSWGGNVKAGSLGMKNILCLNEAIQ